MTKAELIKAVAEKAGITATAAGVVVDALAEQIAQNLVETGEALVPGVGKLKVSERAARTGRNPATGEPVEIAARNTVKFKAAKVLTDAVA